MNSKSKIFYSVVMLLTTYIAHCFAAEESSLDWAKRPDNIKQEIHSTYSFLAHEKASSWGKFNGDPHYYMLGIDEHLLVKQMIKDAYPYQKEFYVMDIGAGNFNWGEDIANTINNSQDLPYDVVLHIIGIRGESYDGPEQSQKEKCIHYKFGNFPIENMDSEFQKRNYDFVQKIDMIISRWTFVHIVDPLGTFIQAYNYLRPTSGVILMDSFRLLFEDTKPGEYWFQAVYDYNPETSTYNFDAQMLYFLSHIKVPLLLRNYGETTAHIHFMIQRPNDKQIEIPVSYKGLMKVATLNDTTFVRSAAEIVQYHRNVPWIPEDVDYSYPNLNAMYGNFKLYQWVDGIEKNDFTRPDWQSFLPSKPLSQEEKEYLERVAKRKEEAKIQYAKDMEIKREKKAEEERLEKLKPENIIKDALNNLSLEAFIQALPNNNNWQNLNVEVKMEILDKTIEIYATQPKFFNAIHEIGIDRDVINYKTLDGTIIHFMVQKFGHHTLNLEQASNLFQILVSLGGDLSITRSSRLYGNRTPLNDAEALEDKSLFEFLKNINNNA